MHSARSMVSRSLGSDSSLGPAEAEGRHGMTGDLVYLNNKGQGILVIGSRRRAEELLEDRSTNYSDRPTAVIQDL